MIRRFALSTAASALLLGLSACDRGGGAPSTTPTPLLATASTQASTPTPPATTTPRPDIGTAAPTFVPNPSAPKTLIVRGLNVSYAVDMEAATMREILRGPDVISASLQSPYEFSPDGEAFAYACDERTLGLLIFDNLCVHHLGRSPAPILESGSFNAISPDHLAWSRNGTMLLFQTRNDVSPDGTHNDVMLHNVTTGATTRLIANDGSHPWTAASWSPNNRHVAIREQDANTSTMSGLVIVDTATGEVVDLLDEIPAYQGVLGFGWSNDGSRLAVTGVERFDPPSASLHVISIADFTSTRIAGNTFGEQPLVWSPDDAWIAATTDVLVDGRPGSLRVIAVAADGSAELALPSDFSHSYGPAWAPNSSQVAVYGSLGRRSGGFFATSFYGGTPVPFGVLSALSSFPSFAWTFDASSIFYIQGAGCLQGGCAPGTLHVFDLADGGATQVSDAPVYEFIGVD